MTHSTLNRSFLVAAAALLALTTASAASLSKADYKAGKTSISAGYKADKTACSAFSANARDVCVQEAKAKEKVARAELEYSYTGKPADDIRVRVSRAESTYAVAKERCDDHAGNDKDVCVKEAKAIEVKALVDARVIKTISAAQVDGAQDIRNADYKVAAEKCESLAGDVKASCMAAAKAKFGKN